MIKYRIISTIRFLTVTEDIKEAFSLMPGIELITDKNKIQKILDSEFEKIAGIIEYDHYINANHILYCEANETHFPVGGDSHEALTCWLIWLEMLLRDSWLIKDNSMICESAYCRAFSNAKTAWTCNRLESSYSLSTGHKHKNTNFLLNELELWDHTSNKLQSHLHLNKSSLLSSFSDKKFSRIGRALRFIDSARKETHPAIKIAHYCSAFESIFSTDNAELSHKLSERVAIFLKGHSYDGVETFDKVKSFYNIRSKVTHGDSLKLQDAELLKLCTDCDSLLRNTLNIIISNDQYIHLFDGQKNEFEFYFKNKLLG
jgi:hypothetical protein